MIKFPSVFFVITASLLFVAESSDTIMEKILNEKRFLVFNSKVLTGECLSVCKTPLPTTVPTGSPTNVPNKNPTIDASTMDPTQVPTAYPTLKPTNQPTKSPTNNPTANPTVNPTKQPTKSPTKAPTKSPTKAPTKKPTNQPTEAGPSYECVWPTEKYSAIVEGDMISGAHSVYKKTVVGGKLENPSNSHITMDGKVYYGESRKGKFNFNKGVEKFDDWETTGVDYNHYEWLAQNMKNSNANGKKVIVKTTGKDGSRNGCYDLYDFRPGGQGYDNGNTLVVFNTDDDICLTKTTDGRQFGPSVLAPFSKVTLNDAGFIDGAVIAKEFTTVKGSNQGTELQLHGAMYNGEIECV